MRPIAATKIGENKRVIIVKLFPEGDLILAVYITGEKYMDVAYIDQFTNCSLMEETYEVEGSILPHLFVPSRSEDKI